MSTDQIAALRILDANYNRACEGLRVVEDYCRFALDDKYLAEQCKILRHDLHLELRQLLFNHLLAARDAGSDVGADITTTTEATRASISAIAGASWSRVEQALRAIEEYAKLLSPPIGEQAKKLRYRAYTLAKACAMTAQGRNRIAGARLYVLVDGGDSPAAFTERITALVQARVDILQLRDKKLSDRDLFERSKILREATRGSWTLFILNDRPDLALLSHADGVHVGQGELNVSDVRRVVGPDMLIGVSTHDLPQARRAVLDGASYIGCGPTFPSDTKTFTSFPGLAFLREVAQEISLPAFAIGGIRLDNLAAVLETGIQRIAVSGAISQAAAPSLAATAFLNRLTLTADDSRL